MEEEIIIYNWIFINKNNNHYIGFNERSTKDPENKNPDAEWIEWNKPLPEDIDSIQYKYENGELRAV